MNNQLILDENFENIQFDVLKDNRTKQFLIEIGFVILLFVISGFIIQLEFPAVFRLPILMIPGVLLIVLQKIIIQLIKSQKIGKGILMLNSLVVNDSNYLINEMEVIWVYLGKTSTSSKSGLRFNRFDTIRLSIIDKNGNKTNYHINNNLDENETVYDVFKAIKKKTKTSKIQFHKSVKFDKEEYRRRKEVRKRYLDSLPLREKRERIRKLKMGK